MAQVRYISSLKYSFYLPYNVAMECGTFLNGLAPLKGSCSRNPLIYGKGCGSGFSKNVCLLNVPNDDVS